MMRYAKVVFGLPIEGPFDYSVPNEISKTVKPGMRVIVPFGSQKKTGYIVNITPKSGIKNTKSLFCLLDKSPILNQNLLFLTKKMSDYYCCSWGEAICAALPQGLRQGKRLLLPQTASFKTNDSGGKKVYLVKSASLNERWQEFYFGKIKETLSKNQAVIIALPDLNRIEKFKKLMEPLDSPIALLYRKQPDELKNWALIKEGRAKIVIGTRASIFAPLENLGLIIVDDENAYGHKQEQSPHYHTREIAFMRAEIEKTTLVLASALPSVETMYLAIKNKIEYIPILPKKALPEIKLCDMKGMPLISRKKNIIFSKYLLDSIAQTLSQRGKILLFLNRLGFATSSFCTSCGLILKCQSCSANLVLHYKENILNCHYCGFKMAPPTICPKCNSNYIRYSGGGTEKMESELYRLFPQNKIQRVEKMDNLTIDSADIFVSTQAITKETEANFGLIGVLGMDTILNMVDFRSTEEIFGILCKLLALTDKKIVIQTSLPNHYVYQALLNNDQKRFFNEELKQRKELKFPPYSHFALVKLRGRKESKVESIASGLFDKLRNIRFKNLEVMSLNPGYPAKLRGNFYRQILIRAKSAFLISKFLKTNLANFRAFGIIITVDMDPI